jgi:hypothetical protein
MTNASPSSVILSAAVGPGRLFPCCLALPSPSSLRPPHLCNMKCYTHPPQRSRPCGEKLPALNVWSTIHIDAREPRKTQHLPHTVTAMGVETPPNFDQQSNKLNTGYILLKSPDRLAYILLRREGAEKVDLGVPRPRIYTFDAFALS